MSSPPPHIEEAHQRREVFLLSYLNRKEVEEIMRVVRNDADLAPPDTTACTQSLADIKGNITTLQY